MGADELSKRRKEGLHIAMQIGYSQGDIAKAIRTSPQNLSCIITRASKRSPVLPRLDAWLEKHVFAIEKNSAASTQTQAERDIALLTSDLRNLADTLESPNYSKDFKGRKLFAWVKVIWESRKTLGSLFFDSIDNSNDE